MQFLTKSSEQPKTITESDLNRLKEYQMSLIEVLVYAGKETRMHYFDYSEKLYKEIRRIESFIKNKRNTNREKAIMNWLDKLTKYQC